MTNSQHLLSLINTWRETGNKGVDEVNKQIYLHTGIQYMFANEDDLDDFLSIIQLDETALTEREREFGDFQTPKSLTDRICDHLIEQGCTPTIVVEPTYGCGNFILSCINKFSSVQHVYGVEIQKKYQQLFKKHLLEQCLERNLQLPQLHLYHDDIFNHKFQLDWIMREIDEVLIIGNPPWVTNSEQGALDSSNLPKKSNFKNYKGLDAITGKSNFDIAEYIILRMIDVFKNYNATLAMLCKNSVAKKIVYNLPEMGYQISDIQLLNIDAKREFDVAAEASLFVMKIGQGTSSFVCRNYSFYQPKVYLRTFGWTNGKFVSDVEKYERTSHIDNESPFIWRSGIKHDCSKVMELTVKGGRLVNGFNEVVDIESTYVYGLIKSSDLAKSSIIKSTRKKVIVTQKYVGESTHAIEHNAPNLWKYLQKYKHIFDSRKSSIYKNKPDFSIFGVGDYSFAPYKVAISGMYKKSSFSLIHPVDGKPVMLDDTCYFLGFDNLTEAVYTFALLQSIPTQELLQAISFDDDKRPYTKDVLMRIDLRKVVELLSLEELVMVLESFGVVWKDIVNEEGFIEYKNKLINQTEECIRLLNV